ncbi:Glycyl-tRNA synthetase beta chain [Candidatus Syntrophocurvum alkaliphilum]|uniref:Glycine--tRNA ligase beta subunit n=1 Tax=Candidatus Syntrophocurvum alkaliphilum TaxID=2293317 RepID=A0A6I6DFS6_9FIRM|nr:glycine--tRNA ligase subunit beta [Candidatus Syntrophocurvum alkaliphilum]QGT99976.1 Glycyl-tRNA synthetase beta chain [Candidatus Syntrophocurvum alkaliphilum]
MANKELLLEIGVEEIPSAYMEKAINDLAVITQTKLKDNRIEYKEIKTYGTPRRLVLYINGLLDKQEDALIENRGPKKDIAYDKEGNFSKAALGFARGQGIEASELEIREVSGVEYLFAVKTETGKKTSEILPELLKEIIYSISFPKSMRWGYFATRFARPIRWILAIYDDNKIDINIENVKSENFTYGHRFLSEGKLEIQTIADYFNKLKNNFVILDQNIRKNMIWEQINSVAKANNGQPMDNDELLEEVTHLVEYPTAFYGNFSESYLEVPPEVLTTSMIEHQRYFPVFNVDGKLLPAFIGVRNGTDYNIDEVRAGNERVLKARLEDALFFWKEDTKKPLADFVEALNDVLFHERLGTIFDKVKRIKNLAIYLGQEYSLGSKENLERAALLCKADLITSMVYEFPELQGIMGRYYAMESGENQEVSEAIFEHYLPRFTGDELPRTETGTALSLAEKMDNLVGSFAIGIKPTGSQDPYALRRQSLGIVNIIIENNLKIDLKKFITQAYNELEAINPDLSLEETVTDVFEFILQRMRGILSETGMTYDVVDAVMEVPASDLTDIHLRAQVVQEFKRSDLFEDFMVVYNRSNNLTKNWEQTHIKLELLEDESEKELYEIFIKLEQQIKENIANNQYLKSLELLSKLRPQLDKFFDSVMVMTDNEELKATRLGLLKSISILCNTTAYFVKVVQ